LKNSAQNQLFTGTGRDVLVYVRTKEILVDVPYVVLVPYRYGTAQKTTEGDSDGFRPAAVAG